MGRTYYSGELCGKQVVLTQCGIGTACSLSGRLNVGDLIVSTGCVQHDFDARPFLKKCNTFIAGEQIIKTDDNLVELGLKACESYALQNSLSKEVLSEFGIKKLSIHQGIIVSGDQFISCDAQKAEILKHTPTALCCEMEGGAVGQVCYEAKIPYGVIRVVSDGGNGDAAVDFGKFCGSLAGDIIYGVLQRLLERV